MSSSSSAISLPAQAQRVQDVLASFGLPIEVQELSETARTAVDAANAIGCSVAQIAKSLIFRARTSGRPVLVMASGTNRVDETLVEEAIGEPIEKADADFVREHTGFAIGGVPPVGHRTKPIAIIDLDLFSFPEIWAAAGTHKSVFRLTPNHLEQITGGRRVAVAKNS